MRATQHTHKHTNAKCSICEVKRYITPFPPGVFLLVAFHNETDEHVRSHQQEESFLLHIYPPLHSHCPQQVRCHHSSPGFQCFSFMTDSNIFIFSLSDLWQLRIEFYR